MLRQTALCAALLGLAGSAVYAQNVVSARSGLIHYVEGQVFIGDKEADVKYGLFPDLKEAEVLRTEDGRAELLLTPGAFLRLSENSSVRMVSNKLADTKVQVLSGTIMLEVGELLPDNAITLQYKDRGISIAKAGLFRVDSDQNVLRVYEGEAVVNTADGTLTVKKAKSVDLGAAVLAADKFDPKTGDEFYRWAARRASYISMANVAAAKSYKDSGMTFTSGQWAWSPWYGMFTYVPYRGMYMSPFGFSFFSPYTVYNYYNPYYYNGYTSVGGGGFGSGTGGGARYDPSVGYNVGSRSVGMTASSPSVSSGVSGSSGSSGAAISSGGGRGDAGGASHGSSSGGGRH